MAATDLSGHLQLPTTIDYPPSTIRGSSVAAFRLRFQSHSRTSPPDSRWAIVARLWPFWPRALGPNCAALNSINASNPHAHALHRPRVLLRKPKSKKTKRKEASSGNRQWTWLFELARVAGTVGRIIKLCRAHTAHAHTWGYYTIGKHNHNAFGPKPKRQLHKTLFTMRGCRLCQW